MSVRYIGSKARLVDAIAPVIGRASSTDGRFVDAFCGTGIVAKAAADLGWSIHLNDHLACAVTMAAARLTSSDEAVFRRLGGYERAIAALNGTPEHSGFIWWQYSPASSQHAGVKRMYFTEANARRIDGIRSQIARWRADQKISRSEERLLIADLLAATNRVANIAGTYGCFLSHWSPQAMLPLQLTPRMLHGAGVRLSTAQGDVAALEVDEGDLVYLDPPYTKRQYAAYYHLLETVTVGDEPAVTGITGLRPWQAKASDFCYRVRALAALSALVERLAARRLLLSYSDQGHVPMSPLVEALSRFGKLKVVELRSVGKYRPNRKASDAGDAVTEYLLVIERNARPDRRRVSA